MMFYLIKAIRTSRFAQIVPEWVTRDLHEPSIYFRQVL